MNVKKKEYGSVNFYFKVSLTIYNENEDRIKLDIIIIIVTLTKL